MPKRHRSQVSTPSDEMDYENTMDGHPRPKRLKRFSSSPLPTTYNSSSETMGTESKGSYSSDGNVFASLSKRVNQLSSDYEEMKAKLAKERASNAKLRSMIESLLACLQSSLNMMHMFLDKLRRERQENK
ncbi:hypothetical protein N7509_009420 [Penicillium cosmopolitanum]|uniref:Uncharacterized protein n=1 Tax=Penicillium cosmopolitanum TaxID=1131564 RepID=A0A9W9VPL0_9EURO|nr:uncharacterized protein N7509_009420 [Penicillium cosmopolitanum]KAJ5386879.1 hypothetical protein N7509_009420 [Penicillium cosmopolitanum]